MPVDQSVDSPVRVIGDAEDLAEARLEAVGFAGEPCDSAHPVLRVRRWSRRGDGRRFGDGSALPAWRRCLAAQTLR